MLDALAFFKMIFVLSFFVSFLLLFNQVTTSCTDKQQETCMERYDRSTSFWFPTNELEECTQKSYAHFSHMCTVENYTPDVDHCCCHVPRIPATNKNYKEGSSDKVVLCCRYNQDWNKFRCEVQNDVLDPNTFDGGIYSTIFDTYPYNIIFYMLFVVLTIILIVSIIHLFRRLNRNRRRAYKQASQENSPLSNISTNVETKNTTIVNSFVLPPYNKKEVEEGCSESRGRLDPQPSAPHDDHLTLQTLCITNNSHEIITPAINDVRVDSPPPPYQ